MSEDCVKSVMKKIHPLIPFCFYWAQAASAVYHNRSMYVTYFHSLCRLTRTHKHTVEQFYCHTAGVLRFVCKRRYCIATIATSLMSVSSTSASLSLKTAIDLNKSIDSNYSVHVQVRLLHTIADFYFSYVPVTQ